MEKLSTFARVLFGLAMAAATVWSLYIPPAAGFQQPQLARIFVWHFPCPLIATAMLFVGSWFSLRYLKTRQRHWDERAAGAHELGYLFCLLTMASGILFSLVQWGAWWQWDPRQTSFLVVLFIYAAYFAVRGAYADPERRAANSAAYALSALLPALFLIYVFPRLPQVQSFHPNDSVLGGNIKGQYAYSVVTVLALMSVLSAWLYRLRLRAGLLEIGLEDNGDLAARGGDPAPTGVVRRVSVPPESGT